MNYPQQPGQWGQQPYGQQPGGQYPPSGPQPGQQPGGHYPPGGPQFQQGMGQQPPGWGQPPMGYGPQQQPKKKTGLIIGAVAGAVVLIGGIVGGIFLFSGGPSAQDVAEDFVAKANAQDFEAANELFCEKEKETNTEELKNLDLSKQPGVPEEMKQVKLNFSLNGPVQENGDKATGSITMKLTNIPEQYASLLPDSAKNMKIDFEMVKENGWKICDTKQ